MELRCIVGVVVLNWWWASAYGCRLVNEDKVNVGLCIWPFSSGGGMMVLREYVVARSARSQCCSNGGHK